jgi:hypothetical protein
MGRMIIVLLGLVMLNSTKAAAQVSFRPFSDTVGKPGLLRPLPQNFYSQRLGFFCRKEIQLQKATSLPVYIRLGSKDYVDYMERKPNSYRRVQ